jgi:hypothetical protein
MSKWTLQLLENVPDTSWKRGYVLSAWSIEGAVYAFEKYSEWADEKELVEQIRDFLNKPPFNVKSKVVKSWHP